LGSVGTEKNPQIKTRGGGGKHFQEGVKNKIGTEVGTSYKLYLYKRKMREPHKKKDERKGEDMWRTSQYSVTAGGGTRFVTKVPEQSGKKDEAVGRGGYPTKVRRGK